MTAQTAKNFERTDLQVVIKGKLIKIRRFDGKNGPIFENLVVIPSKDEFSSPTRFTVKSNRKLAEIEETVTALCGVQSRYWRNKQDGEVNYSSELWLAE